MQIYRMIFHNFHYLRPVGNRKNYMTENHTHYNTRNYSCYRKYYNNMLITKKTMYIIFQRIVIICVCSVQSLQ